MHIYHSGSLVSYAFSRTSSKRYVGIWVVPGFAICLQEPVWHKILQGKILLLFCLVFSKVKGFLKKGTLPLIQTQVPCDSKTAACKHALLGANCQSCYTFKQFCKAAMCDRSHMQLLQCMPENFCCSEG